MKRMHVLFIGLSILFTSSGGIYAQDKKAIYLPQNRFEQIVDVKNAQDAKEGIAFLRQGKYKEAVANFDSLIIHYPGYAPAHYLRGYAYFLLGIYDNAVEDLTKAIEMIPKNLDMDYAKAHFLRGNALLKQRKHEQAIEDYNISLSQNLNDAWIYNYRAYAYINLKEYEKAIQDLDIYINVVKEDGQAYYYRGYCYHEKIFSRDMFSSFRTSLENKAITDFNKALEFDSSQVNAYYFRGRVHRIRKDTTNAIVDFIKVIRVSNNKEIKRLAQLELKSLKKE